MTNEQLYINDQLLDMFEDSRVGVTYQANNVGEMQDRQGDFTNQFSVPKSQRNRFILESMDNVNSATVIPYRNNVARLVRNGIDVVREGIITAVKSTEAAYVLQVNSGNTSFFRPLVDVKVSQLAIPGLTHLNDFATVAASRFNTTGVIYPLIDWFDSGTETAFTDNTVDAEYLMPCIFIKDIFAAGDELTGYTSKGSLIDSPIFPNLILTPNSLKRSEVEKAKYNAFSTNTVNRNFQGSGEVQLLYDTNGYGFDGQNYNPDPATYGYMSFRGAVYYTNILPTTEIVVLRARIYRSGIEIFTEDVVGQAIAPGATGSFYFDCVSVNRVFDSSDFYYTTIDLIGGDPFPEFTVDAKSKWTFSLIDNMPYGATVPAGELFEDINVKDVYQDVLNLFGILVQTNSFKKEIYFDFFDDIQDRLQDAKRWSEEPNNLVDVGKYSIGYKFGKYGQLNEMKFADQDTVPIGLGNGSFTIDDETLPDRVTVVQLSTSATEEEERYQNETYPRIRAITFGTRAFTETNYRILVLDRKDVANPIKYIDSDGESIEVTDSIPYCNAAQLYFDNVIPQYYVTLVGMTRKSKAVSIPMRLGPKHIQELNYLDPVYLNIHYEGEDINGYFYVNKIGPYSGGTTQVELLRL